MIRLHLRKADAGLHAFSQSRTGTRSIQLTMSAMAIDFMPTLFTHWLSGTERFEVRLPGISRSRPVMSPRTIEFRDTVGVVIKSLHVTQTNRFKAAARRACRT